MKVIGYFGKKVNNKQKVYIIYEKNGKKYVKEAISNKAKR